MDDTSGPSLPPPTQGRGGDLYPDAWVWAHTGQRYRLFEDLVGAYVVLINLMSIRRHSAFPVTTHLRQVAAQIGSELGRDVRFLSLTVDPAHDTVDALRQFADQQGAMVEGWWFLTGEPPLMNLLRRRLFRYGDHAGDDPEATQRMVRYGNAAAGVWGACAADCATGLLAERLGWVRSGSTGQRAAGSLKRAGPAARHGDATVNAASTPG